MASVRHSDFHAGTAPPLAIDGTSASADPPLFHPGSSSGRLASEKAVHMSISDSTVPSARTPDWITITQASRRLGICEKTCRRWIADGTLVGFRIGPRMIRLRADQVDAIARPVPNARSVA